MLGRSGLLASARTFSSSDDIIAYVAKLLACFEIPMPRLSKGSKAVRLLRTKFEEGSIINQDPKVVWASEPSFQEHKRSNFRTCFNNLKRQCSSGAPAEGEEEETDLDGLNRRCSGQGSAKKRRSTDLVSVEGLEEEQREGGTGGTQCVTLGIVLPSGVEPGDFSVRVVDGGEYVELAVVWPAPLISPEMLHRKWLTPGDMKHYHPKMLGFEIALKEHRLRCSENVESTARIPLPFPVQTHIYKKNNLGWRDSSARVVYIDLKAFVEDYAVVKDVDAFEVL